MKVKILIISALFLLLFYSNTYSWVIKSYDVEIKVEPNSDLYIEERILVDFGLERRHGIFRDIPLDFYDPIGRRHHINIKDILVVDENIKPYNIKISRTSQNLRIRIGDPNIFVSGIKTYIINYRVKYALYNIGNIDELYWNAIGTGWAVPIYKGSAKVILPFNDSSIKFSCYTGEFRSLGKDCRLSKEDNVITFTLTRALSPREGLTVAVGWSTGLIPLKRGPALWENIWLYVGVYLTLFFISLFLLWWKKGRDIGGRGVIQIHYEPPEGITPIEAGTLIDERVNPRDIVAEIVDLARRGYFRIIEIEEERFLIGKRRDYLFERLKDFRGDGVIADYDSKILFAIFEMDSRRKLSELKKVFYRAIPDIKSSVYQSLTDKRYFFKNPLKIRNIYGILAVISFFFTVMVTFFLTYYHDNPLPILSAGIITATSLLIFGQFMPRKTSKGSLMREYLMGYEEFLSRVERDVIERLYPPEKIPEIFEINLPYAIAFGEAERWVEAFGGLFLEPPKWYQTKDTFSPITFYKSLSSFTDQAVDTVYSQPRSSGASGGGGFSGGGGGGGGGGAW